LLLAYLLFHARSHFDLVSNMRRSQCCETVLGLKKGSWTPEEDQKLLAYIEEHDHGSWQTLPPKAGRFTIEEPNYYG
jgi:hypothetical protein